MRHFRIAALGLFLACCSFASSIVADNSFEMLPSGDGNSYSGPGYLYRPTFASSLWNWSGSAGIAANGSDFGNANAPDGVQVAFIQRATGQIYQDLTGLTVGERYLVSFDAAQRWNSTSSENISQGIGFGGTEDFKVLWDGTSIGSFTPTSTSFATYYTASFVATAPTARLTFQAIDTLGGDRTAFLDSIQINSAPEPWNAITLLSGLGVIALGLRRKRNPV
jgi:hypothetical protein